VEREDVVKLYGGASAQFGDRGRELSIDKPLPTVTVGHHGAGPHKFELRVERKDVVRLVGGNAAPFSAKGRILSWDATLPSVMALNEIHNGHQFIIEQDGVPMPDAIASTKPPYRVPTMGEVGAVPDNGYRIVSTFSGCGGSCLGFEMDGYRVLWASEFVPAAQDVYRLNHPGVPLDTRDIRLVTADDILAATGLAVGEIDVLEGSPPCASFSTAGKREAGWGKTKAYSDTAQRSDDLFFEFVRLLDGLQPRTFVAENVSGLVKGTAKGYFKRILAAMKACGYRVEARLLDAQWLGVPQARQRIIFVGVRNDIGVDPAFPKPLSYRYSVRDALPWIGRVTQGPQGNGWANGREIVGPAPAVLGTQTLTILAANMAHDADITRYAIGAEWDKLKPGESSDRYFSLVKTDPERPCPAVSQRGGDGGDATVTHPTERRKFTIAELKRICAFPDDFVLTGSYAQQWERLGRAVPPLMMRAVATTLRTEVLDRCPR